MMMNKAWSYYNTDRDYKKLWNLLYRKISEKQNEYVDTAYKLMTKGNNTDYISVLVKQTELERVKFLMETLEGSDDE